MKRKRFEKLLMGIGFSRNEVKALTRIMIARFHQPKVEMGETCLGCGYEHNCSTKGCQILREAVEQLRSKE